MRAATMSWSVVVTAAALLVVGCGTVEVGAPEGSSLVATQTVTRHVAPPLADTPATLTVCWAGSTVASRLGEDDGGGVVLYGDGSLADPYDGPMLGLVWSSQPAGLGGDGPRVSAVVQGHEAVVGPMTVFQQVVLPELGTQVAWHDGERSLTLIGRGWPEDRLPELLATAEAVEVIDGSARLPESARPAGAVEVFTGRPSDLALVVDPTTDHEVRYRAGGDLETVTLSGFVATAEEFEAFRFLALDLERSIVGDRTTIEGNAWFAASGPAVVTWRDPDGSVVRVVDLSGDPTTVEAVAAASRDLTPDEWTELTARSGTCPDAALPGLPSAGPDGAHG